MPGFFSQFSILKMYMEIYFMDKQHKIPANDDYNLMAMMNS